MLRSVGVTEGARTRETTDMNEDPPRATGEPTEISRLVDGLATVVVDAAKASAIRGTIVRGHAPAKPVDADLALAKTREALEWAVHTIAGDLFEAFSAETDTASTVRSKPPIPWIGPYRPTPKAIEDTYEVEDEMEMLSFEGMASIASGEGGYPPGVSAIPDATLRKTFFDALIDLHRLVEEYRFHVAFAHLLMFDVTERVREGTAARIDEDPILDQLGIPDEALALLFPFFRRPSSVTEFFREPHVIITGHRRLSSWLAGQLLDSALVRGIAACDRVATLLWTRAGIPIPQRYGDPYLPSFLPRQLSRLDSFYDAQPEWPELKELADHVIYKSVRAIRNGFTHSRRIPSELHGEKVIATADGEPVQGLDVATHLAFGLGFYKLVIDPAVEHARNLLRGSTGG